MAARMTALTHITQPVAAELAIMRANGPPDIRNDTKGGNLDDFFMRETRRPTESR
jgi:hypothetical protein